MSGSSGLFVCLRCVFYLLEILLFVTFRSALEAVSSRELSRLHCKRWSNCLPLLVRADLRIFYFAHYKGISILLSFPFFPCFVALGNLHTSILWEKIMTAISFPFSPQLAMWVLHLVAPAKATGTGMKSEREQLIKSSSSRSTESQFCLPSTMISFYLKVMSYGTFASGNTMSSISMFHLLHKQGQVIPAGFYLGNQSNCYTAREKAKEERAQKRKHEKERLVVFFYGSQHGGKSQMMSNIWTSCIPVNV